MFIVSPTYFATAFSGPVGLQVGIRRATQLPPFEAVPLDLPGTLLEFSEANQQQEVAVPVPRLPGLDDLEVEEVGFDVSSAEHEEVVSVPGNPDGSGGVTFSLASGPQGVARLKRVEIDGLNVEASPETAVQLEGSGTAGSLNNILFAWDAEHNRTQASGNGTALLQDWVHLILRPTGGPPVAAAPHFAMPGDGRAMYGPALGGAFVILTQDTSGTVRAVLRLSPAPVGSQFTLVLGSASQAGPNEGLPNEVKASTWSAHTVRAVFDVRPAGVKIEASTTSLSSEHPLVAQFPSDPGDVPVAVDCAPAARSLLKRTYPVTQDADLGLKLLFTAGSPGVLRVNLRSTRARYLDYPLEAGPVSRDLRGGPETVELPVPSGLRPSALSFTVDGVYGPSRLTLDSDTATPDPRHGMRVAAGVQVARRLSLTASEAHLPLSRLALFGRASDACELLVTFHGGDPARVGPRLAEPLALSLEREAAATWHRVEFPAPGLLPPHPEQLWLVVRATRGVFWWHGAADARGSTNRSADEGVTFLEVEGRPQVQLAVREVDSATQFPSPLLPLSLTWPGGLLNADLVGVAGGAIALPPAFRRFWIAEGEEHRALLDAIGTLEGVLRLTLACQRDVDLSLSEVILTYDPWRAGG